MVSKRTQKALFITTFILMVLKFLVFTSLPIWIVFIPLLTFMGMLILILMWLGFVIITRNKRKDKNGRKN